MYPLKNHFLIITDWLSVQSYRPNYLSSLSNWMSIQFIQPNYCHPLSYGYVKFKFEYNYQEFRPVDLWRYKEGSHHHMVYTLCLPKWTKWKDRIHCNYNQKHCPGSWDKGEDELIFPFLSVDIPYAKGQCTSGECFFLKVSFTTGTGVFNYIEFKILDSYKQVNESWITFPLV